MTSASCNDRRKSGAGKLEHGKTLEKLGNFSRGKSRRGFAHLQAQRPQLQQEFLCTALPHAGLWGHGVIRSVAVKRAPQELPSQSGLRRPGSFRHESMP